MMFIESHRPQIWLIVFLASWLAVLEPLRLAFVREQPSPPALTSPPKP